jgi:hypothetical protein
VYRSIQGENQPVAAWHPTESQIADLLVAFPALRGLPPDQAAGAATAQFGIHQPVATGGQSDDRRHGIVALLEVLAQAAVAGDAIGVPALSAGRGCEPERWSEPGRPMAWVVNGYGARTAAGASLPKGLGLAHDAPVLKLADGTTAAAAPAGAAPAPAGSLSPEDAAVVAEYLRIVQGVLATGQQIIRAHAETGSQS